MKMKAAWINKAWIEWPNKARKEWAANESWSGDQLKAEMNESGKKTKQLMKPLQLNFINPACFQ